MVTRNGSFRRFWRRAYAMLVTVSVVANAAGCATIEWVPLTQAPPMGDRVRLRVEPPNDSASAGSRIVTLYHPRTEDDSVLVGTPVAADTALILGERVPIARTFAEVASPPGTARATAELVAVAGLVAVVIFVATFRVDVRLPPLLP